MRSHPPVLPLVATVLLFGMVAALTSCHRKPAMTSIDEAYIVRHLPSVPTDRGAALEGSELVWFDARLIGFEGRAFDDTENFYERLPVRAKGQINDTAWQMSKHTSGLAVRFVTDSPRIGASWDGGGAMNHMAATGNSGLDLYRRQPDGSWSFVAVGRPNLDRTTRNLITYSTRETREFLLYLPLYQTVTDLQIGVEADTLLAPAYPRPDNRKPIAFYGTSITQGGCASRSGMSHPAILGRWFDREVINLGFSGSGRMEAIVAELLGELDVAAYVIECLPNLQPAEVDERAEPFIRRLRELRPDTPIILVESPLSGDAEDNMRLARIYARLLGDGLTGLHWLPGAGQFPSIENGTVDGVHPTDLGFFWMARAYAPHLAEVLGQPLALEF